MGERFYGSKYDGGLDTAEIAKRVRADIRAAVKAGELPAGLKASVRISRFSGGSSIDVDLKVPGLRVYDVERLLVERDRPNDVVRGPWRSDEAEAVVKKVEAILGAYNHNGSDITTDYFDVKFYGGVNLEGDRAAELALLPAKGAPEAAHAPELAPAALSADEKTIARARAELALAYGKPDRARTFLAAVRA